LTERLFTIIRIKVIQLQPSGNYKGGKYSPKYSLIASSIQTQIDFGIYTSVCYCIGSGDNYTFLSKINKKYNFFDEIIPLEHPRFIMQYNPKHKYEYFEKYLTALNQNHNKEKEIAYR
jgi:lmo2813 protein